MKIDIIYVTYNSERWIPACFTSLLDSLYPSEDLNVYVVDNKSADQTLPALQRFRKERGSEFGTFKVIRSKKNLGFGKGNNLGFSRGGSDLVLFLNADTEVLPDTLTELVREVERSGKDVAMWELRQFPYEHPKLYDPVTMDAMWCSGAAFAVRREVFAALGGFDEGIFMYSEDVDLSWRARSFGYRIRYVPRSVVMHYSYENAGEVKPKQHVFGVINNLLLRYRFGSVYEILKGHMQFWSLMAIPQAFPGSKAYLLREYVKHFHRIPHFRSKKKKGNGGSFKPFFGGWDYAPVRDGGYYENRIPEKFPLVSVLVRTCGRPAILRETLMSLRNQTWPNLEVVVVEDGPEVSKDMIMEEFPDLNVVYEATGEKAGRSRAGNRAMELANGRYLNFLDDDDVFYADHVEVLAGELQRTENRAVYAFAYETPIEVKSRDPYRYEIKNYLGIHKQDFSRIILCHHNYIPIQSIMFEKSLFEEHGGLDVTLDQLEDWDLWVRYSLYTDFTCVRKTTSLYRVPADRKQLKERQGDLDKALKIVREKHKGYMQQLSVYDVATMYERSGLF